MGGRRGCSRLRRAVIRQNWERRSHAHACTPQLWAERQMGKEKGEHARANQHPPR